MRKVFEGVCWGGPYDGKRIAWDAWEFEVAMPPRAEVRSYNPGDIPEVVQFRKVTYKWRPLRMRWEVQG